MLTRAWALICVGKGTKTLCLGKMYCARSKVLWLGSRCFFTAGNRAVSVCAPRGAETCRRAGKLRARCAPIRTRPLCTTTDEGEGSKRGVVVGCYETSDGYRLSGCGQGMDGECSGKLSQLLTRSGGKVKKGDCRLFYDVTEDHTHIAVVGVGSCDPEIGSEDIDVRRQNIRSAAAVGVKTLQKAGITEIAIDTLGNAEACAEGSVLGTFAFDKLKDKEKRKTPPKLTLISSTPESEVEWNRGCVMASAQNFARELKETPSNLLTPSLFVEAVGERLGSEAIQNLDFIPRPQSWIEQKKMGAFMGVAQGATTSPWLLELRYNYKPEDTPTVLVGKGVTFDTGGISIKPSSGMGLMRGDMGGAAAVAASVYAAAKLQLPISLVALIPLCENMPSGSAIKPGDIVTAMNGKTIEVDNTDAEGRLLLADALCYAHSFSPSTIIDLATLTGAIDVALGSGAAAVFTTDDGLWTELHQAGHVTGDRVWRMPLYQQYSKQIEARTADLSNIGARGRGAGACTAAAFLKEFVEVKRWAHLDIAGVMESHGELPFLDNGMSGRPTRTIVQFLENSA